MCHIVGIFYANGVPESLVILRKIRDAISHCNPDGEGFCTGSVIGFNHRRLTILKLIPCVFNRLAIILISQRLAQT